MRDVADLAGVSVKTVSNVVRDWPHVTPQTRKRVQDALDSLGYRMNLSARTLRSGRSGIIALAVPSLDSPYFAELTSELVRQAAGLGWAILVDQTDADPDRERHVVEGLSGRLIDGLIYSPSALSPADIADLRPQRTPMILLGEHVPDHSGDSVAIDYEEASRQMTEYLLSIDRQIAVIGLQRKLTDDASRLRAAGFDAALTGAGIEVRDIPHLEVEAFSRVEGARAMKDLLDRPRRPRVVFCFSDLLALGAVHEARRQGLRIPHDVAIAGFDDVEEGRFTSPTLTTVRPDKPGIVEAALRFLQDRLDGHDADQNHDSRRATPGFELIVRESTRL
ncbi:LacI family DNA-binding transcriptional regulator [Nakamurella sp. PAMC28650]|jgi:LacI family repressor for deo operon, udp, cdd, tsx, nupC, and nupG|uniref:LacI family DNA-binding transcriptional regulator n=1 Tax=Nakamurella sp. PAMC28650 TaxID=2762325 RepID=UPI0021050A99|nr:LacI family DNA-binding transcriptional regulator [Nakamurella sp. PAMC28650]